MSTAKLAAFVDDEGQAVELLAVLEAGRIVALRCTNATAWALRVEAAGDGAPFAGVFGPGVSEAPFEAEHRRGGYSVHCTWPDHEGAD